jgi:multiple sugar transport system substrate-binding protein
MSFIRRRIACAFLVGILGTTLFGTYAFAKKNPYEGVTLRTALPRFYECEAFVDCVKEAAEELGMKIEVSWYPIDDLGDKLLTDYRMNNPVWDIIFVDTMWTGKWVDSGLTIPIEKYINDHPELVNADMLALSDFDPVAIESWTYKDQLSALPLYTLGVAMFYRADLFNNPIERRKFKEKYGYELQVPETYEQFYDVVEFFTRKKGETLAGKVLENDFYGTTHSNKVGMFLWNDFAPYAVALGADQIYDQKTMRPTFNSPEMVAAAKFYNSLTPFLPPGHTTMTSGEATSYMAEGYVAVQMEYVVRCTKMLLNPEESEVADKIGYTVLPSKEGVVGREHAAHEGGTAVSISSISKNKEAAYKLLEKAFSKEIQKKVLLQKWTGGGWIPPRMPVLTDPEVEEQIPYLKTLFNKLRIPGVYYFQQPTDPIFSESLDIATAELSKMLIGKKSPEQATEDGQQKLIELFKREGYIK